MTYRSMSRLDRTIILVVAGILLLAGLLIWRGDRVGLRVTAVTPAADARVVSQATAVRLTFDQPVENPATATLTFTPVVTGSLRWDDGRTLVFTPDLPLQADTAYGATLSGDLVGERGARLQRPFQWRFHTRPARVVYLGWDGQDQEQLFIVDVFPETGNSPPRPLTEEPLGVLDYAIEPAGDAIAYAARREEGGSDLWLIDHDGRNRRALLDCAGDGCLGAAWTPDGRRLVFERHPQPGDGAAEARPPRLWWLDPTTGETAPVFSDESWFGIRPRLSPDGRWLSYVEPLQEEVQTFNLESGQAFIVPSGTNETAAWGPDSDGFVVTAFEAEGTFTLVRTFHVSVASRQLTQISGSGAVDDSNPDWSPDGRWVAVARTIARTPAGRQLVLLRPDGSDSRRLTDDVAVQHVRPGWSLDGRYLAYQRLAVDAPGEGPAIWLIEVATGVQRPLAGPGVHPSWLP